MTAKAHADQDVHDERLSVGGRRRDGARLFVSVDARPATRAVAAPARARRRALLATLAGVALAARLGVWQLDRARPEDRAAGEPRGALARAGARRRRRWRARRGRRGAAPSPRQPARPLARRAHRLPRQPADGRQGRLLRRHAARARRPASGVVLVQRGWVPRDFTDAHRAAGADHARRASSRSTASSPRRRRGCSSSPTRRAGRSGKISTSLRSRARPGSTCCRCRCCSRTRRADGRRPAAPLAGAGRPTCRSTTATPSSGSPSRPASPSSMSGIDSSAPPSPDSALLVSFSVHSLPSTKRRRRCAAPSAAAG